MMNVWSTSCRVRYLVCNITVKLMMNSGTGRWNNYKGNNPKCLRGEDHKQAGFFTHFQTAGRSRFINGTEI